VQRARSDAPCASAEPLASAADGAVSSSGRAADGEAERWAERPFVARNGVLLRAIPNFCAPATPCTPSSSTTARTPHTWMLGCHTSAPHTEARNPTADTRRSVSNVHVNAHVRRRVNVHFT